MKYLLWLLLPVLLIGQVKTVTQTGIKRTMIRGDATTLTWTVSGDYTTDSLLFIAIDSDSNAVLRLTTGGLLSTSYTSPNTTITATIYAATTEDFIAQDYLYDITNVTDSITLIMGLLSVIADVSNLADTVVAPIPYYTVTIDTPSANNNFIIGMDSTNKWYQKTLAQTKTILGIDTLSGNTTADLDSLYTKTSHIVNVKEFDAAGNGVTDDSLAFKNALQYLYDIGGGTLEIPEGHFICGSRWLIPNNNDSSNGYYTNKPIIIKGVGNFAKSTGSVSVPVGGSIVEFTYNGSGEDFILTKGVGTITIEDITFYTQVASKNFFKTTATTAYIQRTTFYGAGSQASASNDAIILGGTDLSSFALDDAPFQGYGSVFDKNYFYKIRRGFYLQRYANAIQITNNTWWNNCGGNIDSVAAIEIVGGASNGNVGNYIAGNLVEMVGYNYFVKTKYANANSFVGNNLYDDADVYAYYRFEIYSTLNMVIGGYMGTESYVSEDATCLNTNTLITASTDYPSKYAKNLSYYGNNYYYNTYPLRFYASDTYRYWEYGIAGSVSPWYYNIAFNDSGTAYTPFQIQYYPNIQTNLILGHLGSLLSASGDLKLGASGSNSVWLGQDNLIYINAGRLFSNLTTGTAPFSITSTTPVDNLTVKRISTPSFIGNAATNLSMGEYDISGVGTLNLSSTQEDTTGLNARDVYIDGETNQLYVVRGTNLVVNGDFSDWTGDNPDNWSHSIEDAGNYVTENPTGKLNFVTDGNTHAWSIYQSGVCDSAVEYGYSFNVVSASANDTIIVGLTSGLNLAVTVAGVYTGTFTATGSSYSQIAVRNEDNAVNYVLDDFRVWRKTGGAKQAPIIPKNAKPQILNPTVDDSLFIGWYPEGAIFDSIRVFDVLDSVAIQVMFRTTADTNLITTVDTLTAGDASIAFDTTTIPDDAKVYLYFIYIGDSEAYLRSQIYWRE